MLVRVSREEYEIGKVLVDNPEIMQIMKNARKLDKTDLISLIGLCRYWVDRKQENQEQ